MSSFYFQVDRYKMSFQEKGTSFSEQIEIDEKQGVEVFRVPAHNNVDGADFYHDFKMVSVWKPDNIIVQQKYQNKTKLSSKALNTSCEL